MNMKSIRWIAKHLKMRIVDNGFCFDDSTVTSVTREYIQKHYGQNDCAYMLFYRQKNRNKSRMDCSDSMKKNILFF